MKLTWAKTLIGLAVLPIGLGIACGYLVHRYQVKQVSNIFSPYRPSEIVEAAAQRERPPYGYIAEPMTVEFGEIENFRRYKAEWKLASTGVNPLSVELVSKTCEATIDGKPLPETTSVPGRSSAVIGLSWVVDSSEPEFRHELVLKTNDGLAERRNLRFQVHGTVIPAIDLEPSQLDFGTISDGTSKELTVRLLCYRTKNFQIEDYSLSNESLRPGLNVQFVPIDDLSGLGGERTPAAGLNVVVRIDAAQLEKKTWDERLLLRSNLPDMEPIGIDLRVDTR
jgi:hypothetical protein